MEDEPFGAWPKQVELMDTVRNAKQLGIDEIFLIGPVGSTKTFAMAMTFINIAYQFDHCVIPIGRKDMSDSTIGTWEVFMEVLGKMNFKHGKHYSKREASNDLRLKFAKSGSIIQFIGMNKSRDPEWSKLKISATCAGVDEVDDVEEDGYEFLQSRTGRRNDNGAPDVTISACNPNDRWTKHKIYYPWLKRENRRLPGMSDEEWDAIVPLPKNKLVIQFEMEDSPLLLKGYYDRFENKPRNWKERFLYNNWNFRDDSNSLFKYRVMDSLTIGRLVRGNRYIGVDPNAGGKDRASIVLWEGDTIVDAELYTSEELQQLAEPHEKHPVMNYGAVLARLTIAMMKRERVPMQNVAGDVVGIGQGWLTAMLSEGYGLVEQFHSGAAPYQSPEEELLKIRPPYMMLRDQMYHMWSMDLDNAKVFFYARMPHLATLKKELGYHEGDTSEKVMRVTPKDEIKKLLGGSPDIADGAMMGYWVRMLRTYSSKMANEVASVGTSYDHMYNSSSGF